jgi:nitroreductase
MPVAKAIRQRRAVKHFDAVGKLVNLPPDHAIAMFVAIGKSIEPAWPKSGQLPPEEVVLTDRFR